MMTGQGGEMRRRLVRQLADPSALTRCDAIDELVDLGDESAVDELCPLALADPDAMVRASAAEALGVLPRSAALRERAERALAKALDDADASVRVYAACSLGLVLAGWPGWLAERQAGEESPLLRACLEVARARVQVDLGAAAAVVALAGELDEDATAALWFGARDLWSDASPQLAASLRELAAVVGGRFPDLVGDD